MTVSNGHGEASQLPTELNDIIARLAAAKTSDVHLTLPRKSQAGVLVLLCPSKSGEVHVLLTTRAMTMRSFPGETALPGGKMESEDLDISATALREAFEETALDARRNNVKILNTIQPYLSKNLLFVVPTVAYTTTLAEDLVEQLVPNAAEVGAIWTWPLRDMLGVAPNSNVVEPDLNPVTTSNKPQQQRKDSKRTVKYSYRDVKWLSGVSFRLHEFQHEAMGSAITGLTAEILLEVALIAYDMKAPYFERAAPGQLTAGEMVKAVLDGKAGLDGDERSALRKGRVTEDTVAAVPATAAIIK